MTDERLLRAGQRILDAAHARGLALSVFVNSLDAARIWVTMGADSLHYSADTYLLAQAMRTARESLRGL